MKIERISPTCHEETGIRNYEGLGSMEWIQYFLAIIISGGSDLKTVQLRDKDGKYMCSLPDMKVKYLILKFEYIKGEN